MRKIDEDKLYNFLVESDRIEGILLPATKLKEWKLKLSLTIDFLKLYSIGIPSLCEIVKVFEPLAELRNKVGIRYNVFVGDYFAPKGGQDIEIKLQKLLISIVNKELTPFKAHKIYESLHPFTNGNGRSGRLIWLWQMINEGYGWPELGFLHTWYYQSLQERRRD